MHVKSSVPKHYVMSVLEEAVQTSDDPAEILEERFERDLVTFSEVPYEKDEIDGYREEMIGDCDGYTKIPIYKKVKHFRKKWKVRYNGDRGHSIFFFASRKKLEALPNTFNASVLSVTETGGSGSRLRRRLYWFSAEMSSFCPPRDLSPSPEETPTYENEDWLPLVVIVMLFLSLIPLIIILLSS